jgi:hypothetical protein
LFVAIAEGNMKQIMGLIFLLTQRFKADSEAEESRLREKVVIQRQASSLSIPKYRSATSPSAPAPTLTSYSSASVYTPSQPAVQTVTTQVTSSPSQQVEPSRVAMPLRMTHEPSVVEFKPSPPEAATKAAPLPQEDSRMRPSLVAETPRVTVLPVQGPHAPFYHHFFPFRFFVSFFSVSCEIS